MKGAATTMTFPSAAWEGQPYPADQDLHPAGAHAGNPGGYTAPAHTAPAHAAPEDPSQYGAHSSATPEDASPYGARRSSPPPTRRTPFEAALPDLRNRLVNALLMANSAHAEEAWRRRRRDPINPHALLYVYAEPPYGEPPTCELRLASRLFLDADEPALPMLLFEFKDRILEHLKEGADPRGPELSNSVQQMSASALYVGLAVSSLDTPAGTWDKVQRTVRSDMDIPGRCYAVLIDGSRLQLDRHAKDRYGQVHILSTRTIRDSSRQPARRWEPDEGRLSNEHQQDTDARHSWAWLHHIHDLITQFHPAR